MNNATALEALEEVLLILDSRIGFFDPDQEISDGSFHPAIANNKSRCRVYGEVRGGLLELIVSLLEEE